MAEDAKLSKGKAFLFPITLMMFTAAFFYKKSPELLSRRMTFKEKGRTYKPPALLNLYFLAFIIPGFDFRFHWSLVPTWLVVVWNALVFSGYLVILLVFKENSYASTIIQVEEEQRVIASGPYTIVRHPMYSGMLLISLSSPLALGSYWAVIPSLLIIPLLILRIRNEEDVLGKKLAGYREYCLKTPYRLIPFIW